MRTLAKMPLPDSLFIRQGHFFVYSGEYFFRLKQKFRKMNSLLAAQI